MTPQRGAILITLDRPRTLFFDMAATYQLVSRFGFSFAAALYERVEGDGSGLNLRLKSAEALPFFLWAALQRDARVAGEELSLEKVEALIHPWNIFPVFLAVVEALIGTETPAQKGKVEASSPTAKPGARKQSPKRKTSTLTMRNGLRLQR